MRNLTGYEPKTAGRGDPSGNRGSGSQPLMQASAAAEAALVPLPQDTLAEDLNNISLTSLQSFLEDDEPMVAAPLRQDTLVSQSQSPTSTMPFVVIAQSSVAGGNSFASSDSHLVPRDLAVQALEYQRSTFEDKAKNMKLMLKTFAKLKLPIQLHLLKLLPCRT